TRAAAGIVKTGATARRSVALAAGVKLRATVNLTRLVGTVGTAAAPSVGCDMPRTMIEGARFDGFFFLVTSGRCHQSAPSARLDRRGVARARWRTKPTASAWGISRSPITRRARRTRVV